MTIAPMPLVPMPALDGTGTAPATSADGAGLAGETFGALLQAQRAQLGQVAGLAQPQGKAGAAGAATTDPEAGPEGEQAADTADAPTMTDGAPCTVPVLPAGLTVPVPAPVVTPPATSVEDGPAEAAILPAARVTQAAPTIPAAAGPEQVVSTGASADTADATGGLPGDEVAAPAPERAHPGFDGVEVTPADTTSNAPAAAATTVAPVSVAAAAGVADAPAPAPGPVSNPVLDQVTPVFTRLVSGPEGTHRMMLRLHPADLGEVHLTVTVRGDTVDVTVAARPEARDLLVGGSSELRGLLESVGRTATQITFRDLPGTGSAVQVIHTATGSQHGANPDGQAATQHGGGPDQGAGGSGRHRDGRPGTGATHGGNAAADAAATSATTTSPNRTAAGLVRGGLDVRM